MSRALGGGGGGGGAGGRGGGIFVVVYRSSGVLHHDIFNLFMLSERISCFLDLPTPKTVYV